MRSILTKIAFTAALVLTFSCGGGGDDGDSNISDLPKQVYLNGTAYNGNGDIYMRFWTDDGQYSDSYGDRYDSLPLGKIQNGKISLNLPENLDSKYLTKAKDTFRDDEYCHNNVSVSPDNLALSGGRLRVTIPDRGYCGIYIYVVKSGKKTGEANLMYFSATGKMTGTETCNYDDEDGDRQSKFDMHFSKGWDIYGWDKDRTYTTDISKLGTPEWQLECDDGYGKSLTKQLFTP